MIIKNRLYRKNFKQHGQVYDLSHLQPFFVDINVRKDRIVKIRIEFSSHTFTEKHDGSMPPDCNITDQTAIESKHHHRRTFDQSRYDLSKSLPKILRGLKGKTIAHKNLFPYFACNWLENEYTDNEQQNISFLRKNGCTV